MANTFRDRERGLYRYSNDASWIDAEPLWVAAERQGVRAATFFWVGSESDWRGTGASLRRAPFDSRVGEAEKVDQILAWIDLGPEARPRLILSWWHGTDHVGHEYGPDDPAIGVQLARQDRELERLLAGIDARDLWPHLTLFVVSDHGMSAASRAVDVVALLKREGIRARLIPAGGAGHVTLSKPDELARALALLNDRPGVHAHASDALPAELRASRADRCGDLVVLVDPPGAFSLRALGAGNRGMHGYRPRHPDMGAIFYALGRGIPAGLAPDHVRAIDLAATVSALLGIEPPTASEGTPIPGIAP